MKQININNVRKIRLNSYRPISFNFFGLKAVHKYNLPPFIDASCRREPDFENQFPSITALCRQDKFAPHLKRGDIVVYITTQGNYHNNFTKEKHNRLVAILQVIEKKKSHQDAFEWYRAKGIDIPSNCMVANNNPEIFEKTASLFCKKKEMKDYFNKPDEVRKKIAERIVSLWDKEYKKKAEFWGDFVITRPLFLELNTPPVVLRDDFQRIFGRYPNTRMPNIISFTELIQLGKLVEIEFSQI